MNKDSELIRQPFNPFSPPAVGMLVDDYHFRQSQEGLGIFYTIGCGDPSHGHDCDVQWCDLPTSSWRQLAQTLAWERVT